MNRPETHPPDTALLVLHALRCAGCCCSPASTSSRASTSPTSSPSSSTSAPKVSSPGCPAACPPGCSPTPGAPCGAERITAELESAGAREAVTASYERFLVLNPELLDLCTAWQLRPLDGVLSANDHRDRAYDARVLDRFADLDGRAAAVRAELSAVLPRFGRYHVRLSGALGRAAAGELEYVADSTASYHTIWAELHEDLLTTLGVQRWLGAR